MADAVRRLLKSLGPLVGVLVAFAAVSAVLPDPLLNYYVNVLLLCGISAIAAVSLNLVLGVTGQFSIGHAGFMAVGAYVASALTTTAGASAGLSASVVFFGATLAAGFAAAGAGWLVGRPSLRLRGDYLAIVTLGFGEIIRSLVENSDVLGLELLGGAAGMSNIPRETSFFWVYAWLAVSFLFSRRLLASTHGRALLAVREDEIAAEAMGVDTTGYKVRAFVLAAFFAGVAGSLFAHQLTTINPKSFTFVRSIELVTMVVLGGMGSTTGALVAAFGLTALPELLKTVQGALSDLALDQGWSETALAWVGRDYKNVIYSLILLAMMLLRPRGLLGHWEVWRLWERPRTDAPPPTDAVERQHEAPVQSPDAPLLEVKEATVRFGGLTAVKSFSLRLMPRELVALIGPNGAGKTTVFNLLTGVYAPTEGEIRVIDTPTKGLRPHRITALGAARTFQNIRLFKDLTVFDNVRIACHHRAKEGLLAAVLQGPKYAREEGWIAGRANELLAAVGLTHRVDELAGSLPYGEQRRLEIARALATGPRLLLLDEPAAGMNAREKLDLMQLIRDIRDRFDVAVLLIEHDMKLVMGVSERIVVLDHGETIASGAPREIQQDPRVIAAYLGAETPAPEPAVLPGSATATS